MQLLPKKFYAALIEGPGISKFYENGFATKMLYAIEDPEDNLTERIGNVLGCTFSPVYTWGWGIWGRGCKTFQYAEKEVHRLVDASEYLNKVSRDCESVKIVLGYKALEKLLRIREMKNVLETQ